MADKILTCKDCGKEFTFTEGEQAFYAEKGFTNEPARCPECRKARKAARKNNEQHNAQLAKTPLPAKTKYQRGTEYKLQTQKTVR